MPIKWSALMVSEAMDMVEEFVGQASDPLEQAKTVANEARKIANLPQYLDQRLIRLVTDIERINVLVQRVKTHVTNALDSPEPSMSQYAKLLNGVGEIGIIGFITRRSLIRIQPPLPRNKRAQT